MTHTSASNRKLSLLAYIRGPRSRLETGHAPLALPTCVKNFQERKNHANFRFNSRATLELHCFWPCRNCRLHKKSHR
jgi:hypothetical protein